MREFIEVAAPCCSLFSDLNRGSWEQLPSVIRAFCSQDSIDRVKELARDRYESLKPCFVARQKSLEKCFHVRVAS